MKIRQSGRVALALTALPTVIAVVIGMIGAGRESPWPGIAIALGTGAVIAVLANLFFLRFGWARADESGVAYRGRYGGFESGRPLTEGERLVIADGRVHVRKPDGTLEGTGLVRWMCARRDWRRLENALPAADSPSRPR